jgi:hypothetical protein
MELRRASTVLGCGCAVVIVFFLVAVLTLTWGTYRAGKDFGRMARDPEAAAERAREVVEFGELPEGYRAYGAFSVPLLLDVAFFMATPEGVVDGETEEAAEAAEAGRATGGEEQPPDRGFLYIKLRDWMGRGDELREALGGSEADEAPLAQQGLDFDPSEVVARGRLVSGRAQVQWLARRGNVRVDPEAFGGGDDREPPAGEAPEGGPAAGDAAGSAGSEAAQVERAVGLAADEVARATAGESTPGILSILAFECPGDDSWHRLAVWFAPDPAPERPADEVDWSGGPGDPAAIADFLGRFELCG